MLFLNSLFNLRNWLIVIGLFALLPVQAANVEGVRLWQAPDHTRIVFDLDSQVEYTFFTLDNPRRVVLDIKQSSLLAQLDKVDFSTSPVKKIRSGMRDNGDLRLVLDVTQKLKPRAFTLPANEKYGNRLVLDLQKITQSTTQKKAITAASRPKANDKRDLIIAIDAGHGGEDPGAIGPNKVREKVVVLQIARKLKALFDKEPGYKAVLIRDGDYYIGLSKRRELAKQKQADLFVSIHADAFKDKRVVGGSVFTLSKSGASSASAKFLAETENRSDQIGGVDISTKDDVLAGVLVDLIMTATLDSSSRAAKRILDNMGDVSKLHKRNVEHAGFAVLKSPEIPSILIETGFISNPKEARRLASTSHQRKIARAIYRGIRDYFSEYATEGTYVYWQQQEKNKVRTYKIARGDTLSEIAQQFSISVKELKRYNHIKGDKIRIGQVLSIPPTS